MIASNAADERDQYSLNKLNMINEKKKSQLALIRVLSYLDFIE